MEQEALEVRRASRARSRCAGASACSDGCARAASARTTPRRARRVPAPPGAVSWYPRIAVPCCSSAASAGSTSAPSGRTAVPASSAVHAARAPRSGCARARAAPCRGPRRRRRARRAARRRRRPRQRERRLRAAAPRATHTVPAPGSSTAVAAGRRRASARIIGAHCGAFRSPSRSRAATSASCSSSAFSGCGHASSRTRAIASASSFAELGRLLRRHDSGAPARPACALLGRRVVEERVRLRAEDLLRERRRARAARGK